MRKMRTIKLMLLVALLAVATVGGALAATSARTATGPGICTNTGCDYPGQEACPFLDNANCANSPLGCVGWVACDPS